MVRLQILVVEDEPDIARVLALLLESSGFEVGAACSLAEARERLGRQPGPALVILDRLLPDGDGLELCREIRERSACPPVLVLSAAAGVEPEALAVGADACVVKPFDLDRLEDEVWRLVRRHGGGNARASAAATGAA